MFLINNNARVWYQSILILLNILFIVGRLEYQAYFGMDFKHFLSFWSVEYLTFVTSLLELFFS